MRDAEHRGDAAKRELLTALRAAFVTPLEPEDVFALSRGIDRLLNHARELINESEAMACPPDAEDRRDGVPARRRSAAHRHGDRIASAPTRTRQPRPPTARSHWSGGSSMPTTRAWPTCSESSDRNERIARRELYRRCSQLGETVVDVAERVVYAVMKES